MARSRRRTPIWLSCVLLFSPLVLGMLLHVPSAKSIPPASPWMSVCYFDHRSAVLKPECMGQLKAMASCWFNPRLEANVPQELTDKLLAERHFTLRPFMSEEEFTELHSDQLALTRGAAALAFVTRLGVPRSLVTLQIIDGGKGDTRGFSPHDPVQQRVELIGCWQSLYETPPQMKLPPFPGRKPL